MCSFYSWIQEVYSYHEDTLTQQLELQQLYSSLNKSGGVTNGSPKSQKYKNIQSKVY